MNNEATRSRERYRVVLQEAPAQEARQEEALETLRRFGVDEATAAGALAAPPAVVVPNTDAEEGRLLVRELARNGARASLAPLRSTAEVARERRTVRQRKEVSRGWVVLGLTVLAAALVFAILPKPIGLELDPQRDRVYRFEQSVSTTLRKHYEDDYSTAEASGEWTWTLARTVQDDGDPVIIVDTFENVLPNFKTTGESHRRLEADLEELHDFLEQARIERRYDRKARLLSSEGADPLFEGALYPTAILEGLMGRLSFPDHARKLGATWTAALSSRQGIEYLLEGVEKRHGRKVARLRFDVVDMPAAEGGARVYARGWSGGRASGKVWIDRATGLPIEIDGQAETGTGWYETRHQMRFHHRLTSIR